MNLTKTHIEATEQKVKETVDKLNSIYNFNLSYPPIFFDVTGTNAGLAKFKTMSVHFNTKLALSNWQDFIDNTVPHEVCHLAAWAWSLFYKKKFPAPHGSLWKLLMREVGAIPKRTHDYDISEVKKNTKTYQYSCGCKDIVEVSSVIHNRIIKGKKYKCTKCNQPLKNGTRKVRPLSDIDIILGLKNNT